MLQSKQNVVEVKEAVRTIEARRGEAYTAPEVIAVGTTEHLVQYGFYGSYLDAGTGRRYQP
jgi:hypothetical protein